ncbi:MAG: bifunctional (p)ppGpp synthetase/guanosine-3',5'-bis(diphosphate) 3'-pyrophosphohydrolase [Lachnospiraceae bacterium]|nr:bifunctional (p)ppGpp synthetase/guanosine-3',5'-bis(diphosphate) 3'-pyrophosphohydrolase [Lachnospiraceae bacterium]
MKKRLDLEKNWNLENESLEKAILFATERHAGQVRKCTPVPYILHPLETMQILFFMGADLHLLMAGVLHDTVEDTGTTMEEIRKNFGEDVKNLVASHTEDKSKTWQERKSHTIETLKNASLRQKMLVMADKVSNLRSMYADYQEKGEMLWEFFSSPREKQAWYYNGVIESLTDMQNYAETEKIYNEMVKLYKKLFLVKKC